MTVPFTAQLFVLPYYYIQLFQTISVCLSFKTAGRKESGACKLYDKSHGAAADNARHSSLSFVEPTENLMRKLCHNREMFKIVGKAIETPLHERASPTLFCCWDFLYTTSSRNNQLGCGFIVGSLKLAIDVTPRYNAIFSSDSC